MTQMLVVLVTCGTEQEAKRIARVLVEEHLAACVTLLAGAARSLYWWKGKTEQAHEALLIVKTSRKLFRRLERRVRELHSYETPEIIACPILAGSRAYLRWMEKSLSGQANRKR